ncbi:MAG TPA: CehA/McbA family metallohydrolase, partial [Phototrophicaceae bacterium]|nr:CehA/McbA family metallohydrolase [Phototrophicaceae bacterium]
LHTHSTRSDGRLSPELVCRFYREAGYDFLAITDHFMERYGYPITDTTPYRSENFTTILGAELHAPSTSSGELWHILADGLPPDFAKNLPDETGPQLAQRARAAGAFVSVAHPAWYALSEQDVISLGQVDAIETINGISADHNDRIDSWYMLDVMLARGYRYNACATDDAHFQERHNDRLRGWVWVKSEALSPEALLAALKRGDYYSSSGPQFFDAQIQDKTVRIRCSPVNSIFVTGKAAQSQFKHGKGMIEAEIDIRKLDSPYCRITIRDEQGNRAWTNPIWLAE